MNIAQQPSSHPQLLTNINKLEKYFSKSTKLILGIKLYNTQLQQQCSALLNLNILPLILRLFNHYCKFIYSLFLNNKAIELIGLFDRREIKLNTRSASEFTIPKSRTNVGTYSFVAIATRLLNKFLNQRIINKDLTKLYVKLPLDLSFSSPDISRRLYGLLEVDLSPNERITNS